MKRTLSILLVLVMLLGMIPVTSLAAGSDPVSPATAAEEVSPQADAADEESKALGVTFTCGEKTYTKNFDDTHFSYSISLEGMADVIMSINGVTKEDSVTVDGEPLAFGETKEYLNLNRTAIKIVLRINGTEYTLSVTNSKEYALAGLELYNPNNGQQIPFTPAFDTNVHTGYTAAMPDYLKTVNVNLTFSPQPTEPNQYWILGQSGWSRGTNYKNQSTVTVSAYHYKTGTAAVALGQLRNGDSKDYIVQFSYYTTLKKLAIDGLMDQSFNSEVTNYHVYVDGTQTSVPITLTPYANNYKLTINGQEATRGTAFDLPYEWDEQGKMQVKIEVSGKDEALDREYTTTVYTLELEKTPVGDTPVVLKQTTKEADYTVITKSYMISALEVIASANGEMTYQWYYNDTATTEGGTAVEGATESSFKPPITEDVIGTRYYFCKITNTGAESNNTCYSTPVRVTVDPDPTPIVTLVNPGEAMPEDGYEYLWNKGYIYHPGDDATPLEVQVTTPVEGGTLEYAWKVSASAYDASGAYSQADTQTWAPPTDLHTADSEGKFYYCEVEYTYKGQVYTGKSKTGETYTDPDTGETYDVNCAYVFIKVDEASAPEITYLSVKTGRYLIGEAIDSPRVTAKIADSGKLSYHWYLNDTPSTEGGTLVSTNDSYNYYNLGTATEEGTRYYYCEVSNTIQGHTTTVVTDLFTVEVVSMDSIIGDNFTGTGTEEDPYQIATAEDYQKVAELVAGKATFEDKYLVQTADITLPLDWEGIGCLADPSVGNIQSGKNMRAFKGTLDCQNHTLTIPEGGLPLFNFVLGATIKNLNIFGKRIAGYGLVNRWEGVGLRTIAVTIDNVTLKSGSATEKAGFIGTYLVNNGYAGCSAGNYVHIKNSTIEPGVVIGYNADQEKIGSFAGRADCIIENCVSYATVYGTDYVGGIVGTCDNAMGQCTITNSQFYGTVVASGQHAGGIVGGGYENSTAPNGSIPSILNCVVDASITGADKVGGLMGGDTFVAQSWPNKQYEIANNSFTGTVQATEGTYVACGIGYLKSLNKYSKIHDNTFTPTCSNNKGIGYVLYVDTSYENPTICEGGQSFNTAKGVAVCPGVPGCSWRANYNRTDDPLGADAESLFKATTDEGTHRMEETVVAPSCGVDGYTQHTCALCGYNYRDNFVDALEHNYNAVVTPANYDRGGFTTYTCANCGDSYTGDFTEQLVRQVVSVYFSLTEDDSFVVGKESGEVMALKQVDVPYFDLALYGLEDFYFQSESYGGGDNGNTFDHQEPYENKVTMLHLFIYATEVYYLGIDPSEAGKGYLADHGLGTEVFDITGSTGSSFLQEIWGMDLNLNYYLNYEYPLASAGWGSTSDQILLEDGDIVTLGHFTSWSFFSDPTSIFNYIKANDQTGSVTVTKGEQVKLNLMHAGEDMMNFGSTAQNPVEAKIDVYYAPVDGVTSGKVTQWTKLGTTNEKGELTVDTEKLSTGEYIIAMAGRKGTEYTDDICSTAGGVRLIVETCTQHAFEDTVVAPTCTAEGYTLHTCEICGYNYRDNFVAATGHSYADKVIAPTCTAEGYTLHTCDVCGGSYRDTFTAATGHDFADKTVEATCTTDGYTIRTCKTCDYAYVSEVIEALGHKYEDVVTAPTHSAMGYTTHTCSVCQHSYVDSYTQALEHSFTGEVTKEPSCTAEGEMTFKCECGESYTEAIPMTAHTYTADDTEPTCTEMGYTTYTCACGDTYVADYVNPTGHDYKAEVTAPTCTAMGFTTYTCACGHSYVSDFMEARGHELEETVTEATCQSYGCTVVTCKHCDLTYLTEITPVIAHTEEVVNAKEATWHTEGYTGDTICAVCGEELAKGKAIPALGCPSVGFADVETKAWYHEAVDYAIANKLMNGIDVKTFAPNGTTTRSMMATLLYRMAGEPDVTGLENPFTDVPANAWYNKAVVWAYSKGIVTGATATTFNPDGELTREQLAVMLWRYADKPEADETVLNSFADVKNVGEYAKVAMAWAVETGLINGVGNQKLEPTGSASRAQIATILMRYIQN